MTPEERVAVLEAKVAALEERVAALVARAALEPPPRCHAVSPEVCGRAVRYRRCTHETGHAGPHAFAGHVE